MGSRVEIRPFISHYIFRPQFLPNTNVRLFDRALLLTARDIEENASAVYFGRQHKTANTPSLSTSIDSYHSMDETVNTNFYSAWLLRSRKSSNESSPEPKLKLPLNDYSRHSAYDLRSVRQLKYQSQIGSHSCHNILTTISHNGSARTETESIQNRCLRQLQNQAQFQISNHTDPTHSKDNWDYTLSCRLSQFREIECMYFFF